MSRRRRNAKQKARAFYKMRTRDGEKPGAPERPNAPGTWQSCGAALFAAVATAVIGWIAAQLFS